MLCLKKPQQILHDDFCLIELKPKVYTILDPEDYKYLKHFHWHLKKSSHCYYVYRKFMRDGRYIYEKMHRLIANTPKNEECHHKNGNSLDNRRHNLLNVSKLEHQGIHSVRTHIQG